MRLDVNNFESYAVVQELELGINVLYMVFCEVYRRKSVLLFLSTNSNLSGCMTTMVINHKHLIWRNL